MKRFRTAVDGFWVLWVVIALANIGLIAFGIWVVVKLLQFFGVI